VFDYQQREGIQIETNIKEFIQHISSISLFFESLMESFINSEIWEEIASFNFVNVCPLSTFTLTFLNPDTTTKDQHHQLITSLKGQGQISSRQFSFKFGRNGESKSHLKIGGTDSSLYLGKITWATMNENAKW
ncbi:1180_t:CDS:2, partial [Gigaspora rosea]